MYYVTIVTNARRYVVRDLGKASAQKTLDEPFIEPQYLTLPEAERKFASRGKGHGRVR
jgi:hypothetical protein